MKDRIGVVTKLLMGAAYADAELEGKEKEAVRQLLLELLGEPSLPMDVEFVVDEFDPDTLDLMEAAGAFGTETPAVKRRLLELVAAVHDADDEYDFAEDEYLRSVAAAIGVPEAQFEDLVTTFEEVDETNLRLVRHGEK
jgi:uncharacterized tellurite resistance protein B-like protein